MRWKLYVLILSVLLVSTACNKNGHKTEQSEVVPIHHKQKVSTNERIRRSLTLKSDNNVLNWVQGRYPFSRDLRFYRTATEHPLLLSKYQPDNFDDTYSDDNLDEYGQTSTNPVRYPKNTITKNINRIRYISGNRYPYRSIKKQLIDYPRFTRQDQEPFWGARGRRQKQEQDDDNPFWGTRGRRITWNTLWTPGENFRLPTGAKQKPTSYFNGVPLKPGNADVQEALQNIQLEIQNMARPRRSAPTNPQSFWSNRGRDSLMQTLFKGENSNLNSRKFGPDHNTVLDDRVFAEEPHFILIERSSRSSAEDDPFFITRGKKKFLTLNTMKAARDRRGAIEEIVKSVRNDPYYIARGKKDAETINANDLSAEDEFSKTKDLICATIDMAKNKEMTKVKREADSERDRRTILKKLAAQLQMDPYFVSRGKKSDDNFHDSDMEEFIKTVADMCG